MSLAANLQSKDEESSMTDIETGLAQCMHLVFQDLNDDDLADASMETVEAWDSLAAVTLNTLIEEQFGLRVDSADLDRFVSYAGILEYLRERLHST